MGLLHRFSPTRTPKFDRRTHPRQHFRFLWDLIYRGLRLAAGHVHNFRLAVGAFVLGGALLAIVTSYAFTQVAGRVRQGETQRFDDAVMHWVAANQVPWVEHAFVEITMLGTG